MSVTDTDKVDVVSDVMIRLAKTTLTEGTEEGRHELGAALTDIFCTAMVKLFPEPSGKNGMGILSIIAPHVAAHLLNLVSTTGGVQ